MGNNDPIDLPQPALLPAMLALWADRARQHCADSPWHVDDLARALQHPWNRLELINRGDELSGAFLLQPFIEANGQIAERVEPFLARDTDSERELYRRLIALPRTADHVTSTDVWVLCGCEGVAHEFGFEHLRTFQRLDRQSLEDLLQSPLPEDLRLIGPDDSDANMAAWAAVYNEAFAGEWRFFPQLDMTIRGFIMTGGHFSLAAVDENNATVGLVLARLEDRPDDQLPQPMGNIWVLAVAPNRRRQGIGEAILRAALIKLREAGASSATIQSDLDSAFRSYRLYGRVGFDPSSRFCILSRQF